MADTINYYTDSKGVKNDIRDLHPARLANATAKLERTDPDNPELPAMQKLRDEQAAAYAAEQQAQEQMR